jgi:hypothetical protein
VACDRLNRMAAEIKRDPDLEWLDHVQPVGLVVAPTLLKELGLTPLRQTQADTAQVVEALGSDSALAEDLSRPALRDAWAFVEGVLGWEARHVAGSRGGPPLDENLSVRLSQQDTTLSPTWAVKELSPNGPRWQLLVRVEAPGVDPDARGAIAGWEATPQQRFERLLRESGIHAGLLITERNENGGSASRGRYLPELRLVYAPPGETSGYLAFPLRSLATVAGRPMLGGLKLLLGSHPLFNDADDRRLPALLRKSREAQAAVSIALAEQVLGALHELLRGLDAAAPDMIRELARERPGHLYEGLLTVLLRLVFILYAEDRDLLPSRTDGRARQIYETSYSVRGLYARLVEDAALNPDTMNERRGAWGQLLALFRLIHKGHQSGFVQARGGKLFDPEQFPFLEGAPLARHGGETPPLPRVLPVSDGCILRILEGLMTLRARGRARERLSYRTLDVEQIGSVYEIVMGFNAELTEGRALAIKAGKHNRTPIFVDLEKLAGAKGKERIKFLKEEADRGQLSANVARAIEAANDATELVAALDPIVDERASPKKHAIAAGTPILQPTDERRRTGSHYTPRSLTAPIVEHALAPTFERLGPDATPELILALKVCDSAMGSGAFLVEACRAIAAKLVEAWSRYPEKKPVIPPDEDEELHARRLVAQRCLYGVDKNPLATDLAKLSLWLATLARDHEFTFLDHALKSGDSLIGLNQAQIAAAHWDTSKPGLPLFRQLVKDRIAEVMQGRAEIQSAPDDTLRAIQEARHRSLEHRIKDIRLIGDAVIATFFAETKPKARERKRAKLESWLGGAPVAWDNIAALSATLRQGAHPLTPFHWEMEFPEVFVRANGGFDAIIGNPPFLGGKRISTQFGGGYRDWLLEIRPFVDGNADLVAHFFRKVFELLRSGALLGLIATKTISQGDSRATSLEAILREGGSIARADRRVTWPGEASVVISVIHIGKSTSQYPRLDGRAVRRISAYLLDGDLDGSPARLRANDSKAFIGSYLLGMGFTFDDQPRSEARSLEDMNALLSISPEIGDRIYPFIGGEELNNDPRQRHSRFAFNLSDLDYDQARERYPELLRIAEELVKPQRVAVKRDTYRENWWRFAEPQFSLYKAIAGLHRALAINCGASPHVAFAFVPTSTIFAHTLTVIATSEFSIFSVLQSRVHDAWARLFASSLGETLRYTPTDCFRTFPMPVDVEVPRLVTSNGSAYYDYRATLMATREEGMTKTYNRFHDPTETAEDIQRLRELHAATDRAVLEAYGWHDLAKRAEPVFLDETNEDDHTYQGRLFWPSDFRDEVLARLLALNAERHAEEVRLGIAPGMKGRGQDSDSDEIEDDNE